LKDQFLNSLPQKHKIIPIFFEERTIQTVISIKAETHNFPTTVEPFNGAATGSGGEIRDRMAGGIGSIPMAGTAVYMTSYARMDDKKHWENAIIPRKWLYQSPEQILIKASNGASDFGNKFGQPLINGSLLTFEHQENEKQYGYDKVIMLAGGIGHANKNYAMKKAAEVGDKVVVLGGDNYRIGMGGGAVSSVATGEFSSHIELNAVQRSNPEMQKRVFNTIRAMAESENNPIRLLHDHGAGGHLNCLSELLEDVGGEIAIEKLPIGDATLSAKEIIGNESQERMGLLLKENDLTLLQKVAKRERAPMYTVGKATGDERLVFSFKGTNPIDLAIEDMFGNPPKTIITDETLNTEFSFLPKINEPLETIIEKVLSLDAVACKDWLTNKVDRSVTGKIARQQCCGPLQLPLSDLGAVAVDYQGKAGIAGIDLPKNKRGEIGLTYIYGIGRTTAQRILTKANVSWDKKVQDWNDEDLNAIRTIIGEMKIEGALRSEVQMNIKRLMDIGCYRGIRHRLGLPVRGQSTKNNARTRKGRKKIVANKKKATK
jgi:phosphoribosylformylglycinamidine synthase